MMQGQWQAPSEQQVSNILLRNMNSKPQRDKVTHPETTSSKYGILNRTGPIVLDNGKPQIQNPMALNYQLAA